MSPDLLTVVEVGAGCRFSKQYFHMERGKIL